MIFDLEKIQTVTAHFEQSNMTYDHPEFTGYISYIWVVWNCSMGSTAVTPFCRTPVVVHRDSPLKFSRLQVHQCKKTQPKDLHQIPSIWFQSWENHQKAVILFSSGQIGSFTVGQSLSWWSWSARLRTGTMLELRAMPGEVRVTTAQVRSSQCHRETKKRPGSRKRCESWYLKSVRASSSKTMAVPTWWYDTPLIECGWEIPFN